MLVLKLREGDYVEIGHDVVIRVGSIQNNRCCIAFSAPAEVKIIRCGLSDEERDRYLKPRDPQSNPFKIGVKT